MKQLLFIPLFFGIVFAQGNISGTLYASDVKGFVMIGCLFDANTQDCDYDKSPYLDITHSGSSVTYTLPNAPAGNYLIIAWKDTNSNSQLDLDGGDEVGYYVDSSGEAAFITAPASNIDIRLTGGANPLTSQPANNPLASAPTTQPAQNVSPLGDLVGIWQMTRASGGDYKNLNTGFSFSMTSGFSTLLKIRADGSYIMQFYSSGVSSTCARVTNFENSVGTATYQGNQLMLQPAWHTLEVEDCDATTQGKVDLGVDPIVYTFTLQEEFDYRGMRGATLKLEGGTIPFDLDLLHRVPLIPGYQPKQPADFIAGSDPAYREIVGLWTPSPNSDTNFYNPQTGEFYIPERNGASHHYLRFNPDGSYELGTAWPYYNLEGVCEVDYIYYERGMPSFASEIANERGASGDVKLEASEAKLIANIRNCDADDEVLQYDLGPHASYYYWSYSKEDNEYMTIPETFSLKCDWEMSEWQFFVCSESAWATFGRRQ